MSEPQPLPSNETPEADTTQGILSNIGCPDIPIRQAARSAFSTVVWLVGLEGSSDQGNAEPVLLNEECNEVPEENVGRCARSARRKCPKCPPPPFGEYTKSAIQAISNLLGLHSEPVEEVVNPEDNAAGEENATSEENANASEVSKAGSDVPAATDSNAEENSDSSQEQVVTNTGRCANRKCPPLPFGKTTRNVANAIGQYIGTSKQAGDNSKPEDEVAKEETTEANTEDKEQAITKADLEKPACPPQPASYNLPEGVYTQTDNTQLSIVTRSAYQTVVRLIGIAELPEEKAPEPELVNEEHEDVEVIVIPEDRVICRTCARYGRKKCSPPPLGQYTKSAIRTISNMKEYMRTVRLMRVSEETSAKPNIDDEKINEDTSVLEGESNSSSPRPSSSHKPPNYSIPKQPDVPLKQATRNAFQATVRLAGLDDIPRKQPEMVNATDGQVTREEELQENIKSCSKHGKKKCSPPPLSEYTKSAIQGISNLIGMQKEDVEEKVSNESNNDEGETTDTAPCAEANATTTEGQPSEEGSSNTASAQSTCGQCRSKCAPPPLAESTRSACRAIGRFVGLGGEEVGDDSVTKDENAEGEGEKNESTIAEGQPSGEESSNKAPTESTWGQCRSKCSPSPLAESTRSACRAIGRFIGLGGEEVGNDSVTKDENAEVEKNEANAESAAADCQPKPTSFKTRKIMHNRTMTLNETTNAVFRMFGRMLGATREGVYVPKRKETRGEEKAEEIQEEDTQNM